MKLYQDRDGRVLTPISIRNGTVFTGGTICFLYLRTAHRKGPVETRLASLPARAFVKQFSLVSRVMH